MFERPQTPFLRAICEKIDRLGSLKLFKLQTLTFFCFQLSFESNDDWYPFPWNCTVYSVEPKLGSYYSPMYRYTHMAHCILATCVYMHLLYSLNFILYRYSGLIAWWWSRYSRTCIRTYREENKAVRESRREKRGTLRSLPFAIRSKIHSVSKARLPSLLSYFFFIRVAERERLETRKRSVIFSVVREKRIIRNLFFYLVRPSGLQYFDVGIEHFHLLDRSHIFLYNNGTRHIGYYWLDCSFEFPLLYFEFRHGWKVPKLN